MKLEMKNLTINGDAISGVLEFIGSVNDIQKESYSARTLSGDIEKQVSYSVAQEIIKTRSGEIMKNVDIEEIIKRIQLNVVGNLMGQDRR